MIRYLLAACLLIAGCSGKMDASPHVIITTELGEIEVELYAQQAPKTVAAFLSYVDKGLYKRSNFYRVLNEDNQPSNAAKTSLIQGGIWQSNPAARTGIPGIPHEPTSVTKILHTNGTISLAREAPGTGTTEFFICVGDQPGLNYGGKNNPDLQGYAAFGKVVDGMTIVRKIHRRSDNAQYFDEPVMILDIRRK